MELRPYNRFTPERQKIFLQQVRTEGLAGKASQAAGVSRFTPYKLREKDSAFRDRWQAAVIAYLNQMAARNTAADEAKRQATLAKLRPARQEQARLAREALRRKREGNLHKHSYG